MSPKALIRLCILLLTLFTANAAFALPVTFQVHMTQQIESNNFNPGTDFVDLAGTFNDWGTNPLTPLSDANGDSIYEITLDNFTTDQFIEYKFRINGQWDGTEEFPGMGSNRTYTVQEADNTILVWYNDFAGGGGSGEVGELHWWNDSVFYEIFVRSFNDSDGDGIGDFQGLTQKLDYLNDGDPSTTDDLGITGIWLMPINDSPSYHGYDAVDYQSINPDYGTMADFQAFLAAAHDRGIKVIIDYVMNHCSTQHPWFTASAQNDPTYRDYFRWSAHDPGQTGPWGQNLWHWNNSSWYYGLFWSGMPDLNYDNDNLKTEMFDTATYWLDTIGVDGFRLDAVLYIHENGDQAESTASTFQFWHDYNTHVKSVNPNVVSVGEAWTATSTVLQYVINDRLDFCFEFDLSYATMGAANNGDAAYLGHKASQVYGLYPYLQFGTFLTNHDQDRALTVLGQDISKAKVAAGIYMTLPGIPFVYYGEEIGMIGSGDHKFIRSPMQWSNDSGAGFTTGSPWQAFNGNYAQYNVETEAQNSESLLSWYKTLIHARNQSSALRGGTHASLESSASSVLAFVRQNDEQTVLCLANTSPNAVAGLTVTGDSNSLYPGQHTLINLLDPSDSFDIIVSPTFEITGLNLSGHQVAAYEIYTVTAVDPDQNDLPQTGLRLEYNAPNPFNPSTTIHYTLPESSHVRVGIYDVAGREVAILHDGVQNQGRQTARWNGQDDGGQPAGAGVYVVRLEAGQENRNKKIVLVK